MKSARSISQSAGPAGSPMSYDNVADAAPLDPKQDMLARTLLSKVALADSGSPDAMIHGRLLQKKKSLILNPESKQLKSARKVASVSHASYRSGAQHSIQGLGRRKAKFKKSDRQQDFELVGGWPLKVRSLIN